MLRQKNTKYEKKIQSEWDELYTKCRSGPGKVVETIKTQILT